MQLCAIGLSIFVATLLSGCYDSKTATKTLIGAGYSDIKTDGHSWFVCPKSFYSTKFEATGPTGVHVEGAVCSGVWLRNAQITFD